MSQEIDSKRVRQLRERRGLSQQQLARKVGRDKQTVYRWESGAFSQLHPASLDALAKALGTEPGVLTGADPLPDEDLNAKQQRARERQALTFRVDGAIRNAYTMVARRYRVSAASVAELAPFLFLLVAEQSLQRRRENLERLRRHLDAANEMESDFLHVGSVIIPGDRALGAISDELRSIEANDILAGLPDLDGYYDAAQENPFARYLNELASNLPVTAQLNSFMDDWVGYEICKEDARALCANDELLTRLLLDGDILLHELPRELMFASAVAERLEWFRAHIIDRLREGWDPSGRVPNSVYEAKSREPLCEWFKAQLDESAAAAAKLNREATPLKLVTPSKD